MSDHPDIVAELQRLVATLRSALPAPTPAPDFEHGRAFRWRAHPHGGYLETVRDLSPIRLADLRNIDRQKADITRNTAQFVRGRSEFGTWYENSLFFASRYWALALSVVVGVTSAFRFASTPLIVERPTFSTMLPALGGTPRSRPGCA